VVDVDEYLDILGEAARARNGWKCILRRCAPAKEPKVVPDRVSADVSIQPSGPAPLLP
jgi:hypothetical protein